MNRRGFFTKLGLITAGFSILPAATTYARSWIFQTPEGLVLPNPEWVTAQYEIGLVSGGSLILNRTMNMEDMVLAAQGYGLRQNDKIIQRVEWASLKHDASVFGKNGNWVVLHSRRFKSENGGLKFVPPFKSGDMKVFGTI